MSLGVVWFAVPCVVSVVISLNWTTRVSQSFSQQLYHMPYKSTWTFVFCHSSLEKWFQTKNLWTVIISYHGLAAALMFEESQSHGAADTQFDGNFKYPFIMTPAFLCYTQICTFPILRFGFDHAVTSRQQLLLSVRKWYLHLDIAYGVRAQ